MCNTEVAQRAVLHVGNIFIRFYLVSPNSQPIAHAKDIQLRDGSSIHTFEEKNKKL